MKMILKQPGLKPETIEQDEIRLADLQHYVEGNVECPYIPGLSEAGVTMWANEEGLILRMQPNLIIDLECFFEPMLIVGPVLFTSSDDEGNTTGLTPEQEQEVQDFLATQEATFEKAVKIGLISVR